MKINLDIFEENSSNYLLNMKSQSKSDVAPWFLPPLARFPAELERRAALEGTAGQVLGKPGAFLQQQHSF